MGLCILGVVRVLSILGVSNCVEDVALDVADGIYCDGAADDGVYCTISRGL